MGGVGDGTQRPETAIFFDQETRVKAAERMIAARGHEASDRDSGLRADVRHQFVQGVALIGRRVFRIPAEVGDRLEVNAADARSKRRRQADQIAEIIVVDAPDHCGDQGDPDSESGAAFNRLPLGFQQSAASKPLIDVIPGSVKLQEHNIQSGLAERLGIAGIFGKADAVGVHLGIAAPGLLRIAHQLRKVVPQGGFSPGKLQKRLAALPDDLPDCLFHLLRTGVFRIVPAVCEAVTAVQVTALRHLQQYTAAPALMLRADAAVRRAVQAAVLRHRLRPQKPLIEIQPAAPDGHRKAAVLRAALL